ncbi:hypothetical protein NQ318_004514 [Aromia moschata]|uniref:Uncharacterized protein n=1 Tax=Aromia moschata TaxID=1265417 RepID=A0AAV8Y675_9CUCU|nr:hypothetical protein NQ318_004514 [Aromia moschata]
MHTVWANENEKVDTIVCIQYIGCFSARRKSHFHVFLPLMKALAQKGQNMTVISNFTLEKPLQNYKDIDIGGVSKAWVNIMDMEQANPTSKLTKINNVVFLRHLSDISCDIGLSSRAVENFLKTKDKYVLMITESTATVSSLWRIG